MYSFPKMPVVSDCQLSHHFGDVIRWSSVQPSGHSACFDISYDFLEHIYAECIITEIYSQTLLVKDDRYLQLYRKRLYCPLDSLSIFSAVRFLLET